MATLLCYHDLTWPERVLIRWDCTHRHEERAFDALAVKDGEAVVSTQQRPIIERQIHFRFDRRELGASDLRLRLIEDFRGHFLAHRFCCDRDCALSALLVDQPNFGVVGWIGNTITTCGEPPLR